MTTALRSSSSSESDVAAALYRDKHSGYFEAPRRDLLEMVADRRGLRVLELGAGSGATLRAAKAGGVASFTVGIDIVEPDPAPHDEPAVDQFHVCNFESTDLGLAPESFDLILCADVLEHLIDPWATVKRLHGLLSPGGALLSSIPNARNFRSLRQIILRGDFRYEEAGLLDRSHLRFFCRKNICHLFEDAGLEVVQMAENMGGYGAFHRSLDRLTLGLLHEFFVFQYRTLARKPQRAPVATTAI
ncbi:MAG TPA: class I SAM-dependent methyltransferase [Thermoanaerobaculia bacterium]|nr:class I SAM-dependent methyltransferase [Thermoanaerobaculia bacterium]